MNKDEMCPECVQGKHDNCTGWGLNVLEDEVQCSCEAVGHDG